MRAAPHTVVVALLVVLPSCFEPVDVGSNDAGPDGGTLVCTVGQDQTCNELASMSALAGACGATGCVCLGGFEKGPTGKCRPQNSCPPTPQQPGQACTAAGVTCRYGYQPLECGGRTVRCEGSSWVEVEHTDPQGSCQDGGLTCRLQDAPVCVFGTPGGQCGDAAVQPACVGGAWRCPATTIPSTECACSGLPPQGCTCTAGGWRCPVPGVCTPGLIGSCNDDMALSLSLGTCSALSQCECVAGAEVNPATGRCRPGPLDGGTPVCTGSGTDQACNELVAMSSFAGQCLGGRCFCAPGFELSPSGRCQPRGSTCTDRVPLSCTEGVVDAGVGGVAGTCVGGQCVCATVGAELNPRTGRCRNSRILVACTVGQDQTCSGDFGSSALAGQCLAGRCTCNPGFALASDGRCVASNSGYCVVNTGSGACSFTTLDGGTSFNPAGLCGTTPLSTGCTCSAGSSPGVGMAFCTGACPPTAGTTCVTTNCGMVNCLPPARCIGENRCVVP
jgi:hypothetical protein